MRVVAAALVLEVGTVAVIVTAVFAHKAFATGPGLDEGAVHAEALGLLQHQIEEFDDDGIVLDQTLAVLGEHGEHPHGVVHGEADEPAKQQIIGLAP